MAGKGQMHNWPPEPEYTGTPISANDASIPQKFKGVKNDNGLYWTFTPSQTGFVGIDVSYGSSVLSGVGSWEFNTQINGNADYMTTGSLGEPILKVYAGDPIQIAVTTNQDYIVVARVTGYITTSNPVGIPASSTEVSYSNITTYGNGRTYNEDYTYSLGGSGISTNAKVNRMSTDDTKWNSASSPITSSTLEKMLDRAIRVGGPDKFWGGVFPDGHQGFSHSTSDTLPTGSYEGPPYGAGPLGNSWPDSDDWNLSFQELTQYSIKCWAVSHSTAVAVGDYWAIILWPYYYNPPTTSDTGTPGWGDQSYAYQAEAYAHSVTVSWSLSRLLQIATASNFEGESGAVRLAPPTLGGASVISDYAVSGYEPSTPSPVATGFEGGSFEPTLGSSNLYFQVCPNPTTGRLDSVTSEEDLGDLLGSFGPADGVPSWTPLSGGTISACLAAESGSTQSSPRYGLTLATRPRPTTAPPLYEWVPEPAFGVKITVNTPAYYRPVWPDIPEFHEERYGRLRVLVDPGAATLNKRWRFSNTSE